MRLGMVTYLWGAEWDLPTLLKRCQQARFEGVELRSTHKHGVEIALTDEQRKQVRGQFEEAGVEFVGPGSACEYHSPEPAVVRKNIEETKQFLELSHDLGGTGVKVRPNGFVKDEDRRVTIERLGKALHECGECASGFGQEVRVEVHGPGTQELGVMRQIMQVADHPQVVVCWNSNPGEVVEGSVKANFELVADKLGQTMHIHDLFDRAYPYRELFGLLKQRNYDGFLLSESPATADPEKVMNYYRAMFDLLVEVSG